MSKLVLVPWVPRHGVKSVATRMIFVGIEYILLGNDVLLLKRWFGIRVSVFGRVSLRGRPVAEGLTLDSLMIPSYGRPLTRFLVV